MKHLNYYYYYSAVTLPYADVIIIFIIYDAPAVTGFVAESSPGKCIFAVSAGFFYIFV